MNIILVSDSRKAPRSIDLRHPRQRLLALGALAGSALALIARGRGAELADLQPARSRAG